VVEVEEGEEGRTEVEGGEEGAVVLPLVSLEEKLACGMPPGPGAERRRGREKRSVCLFNPNSMRRIP